MNVEIEVLELEVHVTNILLEMGIPTHLKGARYLKTAILKQAEEPMDIDQALSQSY